VILIKKVWDRIVDMLEKEYGLNYNTTDIRFMYLIYFAYLNVDDKALARKSTEMIKKAYEDYNKQFSDIETISLTSFYRSIYRTVDKMKKGEIVVLAETVKEIVERVEI
jgi:hypothetical protein